MVSSTIVQSGEFSLSDMVAVAFFTGRRSADRKKNKKAGKIFSTALEINKAVGCLPAHGLVCLFVFSGHSARAGQTLAKEAIKVKKSAVAKAEHRVHSFNVQKVRKKYRVNACLSSFFKRGGNQGPPHPSRFFFSPIRG
jgi:hypothetical protein